MLKCVKFKWSTFAINYWTFLTPHLMMRYDVFCIVTCIHFKTEIICNIQTAYIINIYHSVIIIMFVRHYNYAIIELSLYLQIAIFRVPYPESVMSIIHIWFLASTHQQRPASSTPIAASSSTTMRTPPYHHPSSTTPPSPHHQHHPPSALHHQHPI